MKNFKSIIWGIILVVLGIILGGNALGIMNIDIFFSGWWTLFIIIPCFCGLITDEDKTGSLIGLSIGVILLLSCLDVIDFDIVWKLLFPIIIVIIGLSLIFKNTFKKEINEKISELNKKINDKDELCATFSGLNQNFDGETFEGLNASAIFGGVKLDLRDAKIKNESVINATSVFGGIDIYVPKDVVVKVKSNSIFGGVTNKNNNKDGKKVIYVNAMCLFGGVEIK